MHSLRFISLIFICVVLLTTTLFSKTAPYKYQRAQQDSIEQAEYEAISISEITIQANNVTLDLLKSEDFLKKSASITNIENQLPGFLEKLNTDLNDPVLKHLDLLRGNDLVALQRKWEKNYENLISWQDNIKNRVDALEEESNKLVKIITQWRSTYAKASETSAPQEIRVRINQVISETKKLNRKFSKRVNDLLIFQNKIANDLYKVNSQLVKIITKKEDYLDRIVDLKSPRIWDVWISDVDSAETDISEVRQLAFDFRKNLNYITNIEYVSYQVFVWLLVAFLFIYIKKKSSFWTISEENRNLRIVQKLSHRPLSIAFVVAFFVVIFTASDLPHGFGEINLLFLTIPIASILHIFVRKPIRKYIYFLFFIYVFLTIQEYLILNPILERNIFLLLSVLALYLVVMIFRNQKEMMEEYITVSNTIKYVTIIAILIFINSIVMNIIGRVEFAKLLTLGMIRGIYYAILIRLFAYSVDGMIATIFRARTKFLLKSIQENSKTIEKHFIKLTHFYFVYLWIKSFLNAFTIYEPVRDWVIEFFTKQWMVGSVPISITALLLFFFIIVLTWYIAKVLRIFLEKDIFSRYSLPRGVPGAVSMIVRYIIVTLGFFLAIASAGIDISTLGIVAGGLGVGLGFGLQNIVSNLVSGLILTFERPVQSGDTVEVGQLLGNVTEIGVRSSKIKTFDGSEVIVPNTNLISNEVINWSLSDRFKRMRLPFITDFGSNPTEVVGIIIKVIKANPKVLPQPEPLVLFDGYTEHGLNFDIRFWVNLGDTLEAKSEIAIGIHDALLQAGIDLPIPRRNISSKDDYQNGKVIKDNDES